MKQDTKKRLKAAGIAALLHFVVSTCFALLIGVFVFGVWYPFPYNKLSGGIELFFLVVTVDVVVGPMMTLAIFNLSKPRKELLRDMTLVAVLQLFALGYGLWSLWQARPLFMVAEIDRFKVISRVALKDDSLSILPSNLLPSVFSGPQMVAIREPKDQNERSAVLFESINGGRDYGERPEFYLAYEGERARASLAKSRPLKNFLEKFPQHREKAREIAAKSNLKLEFMRYLPVVARQEWIALLNDDGLVIGYLRGDGF